MASTRRAFAVHPEVEAAVARGRAVVALETAVLTHGLPRPINLEVYREMEEAVRRQGAVPAAVGVARGRVCVGLGEEDTRELSEAVHAEKAGLADLPVACAQGAWAGTTVAATLWAAQCAGVSVFATGGIGGVHRGAEVTFDVSGDLVALARFGGCVVCSGAKAVLDLPKTFEVLEALGVTVLAFGSDELPAFTCRGSGLAAAARVDSPGEVAAVLRARNALGLASAVLVAHPPPEPWALGRAELDRALAPALEEAASRGLVGKALTPFLLDALARGTRGATVEANRHLLVANARLAAEISLCLAEAAMR